MDQISGTVLPCTGAPGGLLGKPIMGDQDLVGAALLSHGFYPPNTVWALTINRNGVLRQQVQTTNYQKRPRDEFHYQESRVSSQELAAILGIAQQVAFGNFLDVYNEATITSQATFWLAVRFETGVKTVEAYAPAWLAAREHEQMLGFLKLWGAIHRFAPFPSIYNDVENMIAREKELQALKLSSKNQLGCLTISIMLASGLVLSLFL